MSPHDQIYAVQRYHAIGVQAMALSDHRLAVKMFEKVVTLQPLAQAYLALGEALGRAGRRDEAKQAFLDALKMDPTCADAWYNMGVMWEQGGDAAQAGEAYEKGLAIRETPEGRNNLANTQRALLKLEEAEANYRRAAELGYGGAQMNLSLLLMLKGNYVEGLELFEQRDKFASESAYGPARAMLAILEQAG